MSYTHLLFDLDGTLFDFEEAQRQAFFQAMAELEVAADDATLQQYDAINAALWKKLEQKAILKQVLLTERFALLFAAMGVEKDAAAANACYLKCLAQQGILLPGATETLERLKGHFVMVAVTNGVANSQRNRLKAAEIAHYFEALFISEELGAEKPDLRFFEHVTAAYPTVAKEKMLLIGDSLSADIQGGKNFGVDTCWINPNGLPSGQLQPNFIIKSVIELLPIVGV